MVWCWGVMVVRWSGGMGVGLWGSMGSRVMGSYGGSEIQSCVCVITL